MKKKIIIILSIVSLLLVLGGTCLIRAIDRNTSKFDEIIMFHQVEILREQLLLNIRRVEADLYSQSTVRAESIEAVAGHINAMKSAINDCFKCHHVEAVMGRLNDLHNQINQYHKAANKVVFHEGGVPRRADLESAHLIGDSLISKVNTMIVMTNRKLQDRTDEARREVHRTRWFLIMVITAGPLLMAAFAWTVLKGVTGPIRSLLTATRKLKSGDLDHRIEGLRDEFGELAVGFNIMAGSLKEQLRKIEESEKRYRLLFESAGDAIFILDAEGDQPGRIMAANRAAVAMHGYSLEELLSMSITDIDAPEERGRAPGRIGRMLAGEWIKMELNHVKKDGTVFPIEVSAGMLESGDHRFILALDRDITERKNSEEALKRTEQIKTAGELATGLAHEIKNPLAGIKASIEVLSSSAHLPDEDKDILVRVIEEIKRIESLMKNLLNFARPSRPQLDDTDVNAVLASVADFVVRDPARDPAALGAIVVRKELSGRLPLIRADVMQLKQVFMNLIMNAVDAMQHGGTLTLKTHHDADARFVTVEISDTGRGIDGRAIEQIFQPFFTTKAKGTGLGLAISKRLIEDHGGRISAVHSSGGGVTFTVLLPAGGTAVRDGGPPVAPDRPFTVASYPTSESL